ncbi:acyl-CoA dehydrogenase family protein [Spongisporangium articulatum]|uniref:Acyl-CoA dehydrogenase family protein n=1 Tax=Spongisporangium articulatum TaxID=3362603 RepID=A0ABW8AKF1_9ACTN
MSSTARPRAKFDPIRFGLAAVNRLASSPALDRFNLRKPTERVIYTATKTGFQTVTAASRVFARSGNRSKPARPGRPSSAGLFDLTPTEDQQMLVEVVREFASEKVRPVAAEADAACAAPADVLATAAELGITQVGVPEEVGGLSSERTAVTNVLVAEALAHGDLGIAVSCLAPAAVSSALSLWGTAAQQDTYLPALVGDAPPAAALTLLEPRAGFDPGALQTVATPAPGGGYTLSGVKSLVPQASTAELFLVAAQVPGSGPALFVVESGSAGLTVESEPAMGLRAAGMGRLLLDKVSVPGDAMIPTTDENGASTYTECVRLGRLGWAALALGVGQAVVDYVIPYVNDREAFGEPISHRQAVAFTVADMAIELDGARLVTYRAASRAEQGLSFAREVALARRLASDKGMFIGSAGVQLLGGHGYVKEHPVERWYRDLRAIGLMEGVVLV